MPTSAVRTLGPRGFRRQSCSTRTRPTPGSRAPSCRTTAFIRDSESRGKRHHLKPHKGAKHMQPTISAWAFVLAVPDLNASAAYFRDVLGFRVQWENATEWRLVERDGVRVMLGHCPNDLRPADLGSTIGFVNQKSNKSIPRKIRLRRA